MNFEQELQLLLQKYLEIESVSYETKVKKTVTRPTIMAGTQTFNVPPARTENEVAPGIPMDVNPDEKIKEIMGRTKMTVIKNE